MAGVIVVTLLALLLGLALGAVANRLKTDDASLVEQIDQLLPQTQCAQCGYPGCRPYANAIAEGSADIQSMPARR